MQPALIFSFLNIKCRNLCVGPLGADRLLESLMARELDVNASRVLHVARWCRYGSRLYDHLVALVHKSFGSWLLRKTKRRPLKYLTIQRCSVFFFSFFFYFQPPLIMHSLSSFTIYLLPFTAYILVAVCQFMKHCIRLILQSNFPAGNLLGGDNQSRWIQVMMAGFFFFSREKEKGNCGKNTRAWNYYD